MGEYILVLFPRVKDSTQGRSCYDIKMLHERFAIEDSVICQRGRHSVVLRRASWVRRRSELTFQMTQGLHVKDRGRDESIGELGADFTDHLMLKAVDTW